MNGVMALDEVGHPLVVVDGVAAGVQATRHQSSTLCHRQRVALEGLDL